MLPWCHGQMIPAYLSAEGEEDERDCDLVNLDDGYELPFRLKREPGEDTDGCVLRNETKKRLLYLLCDPESETSRRERLAKRPKK